MEKISAQNKIINFKHTEQKREARFTTTLSLSHRNEPDRIPREPTYRPDTQTSVHFGGVEFLQ